MAKKHVLSRYKRTIPGLTLTIGFGPQLGPLRLPERPKNCIGLKNYAKICFKQICIYGYQNDQYMIPIATKKLTMFGRKIIFGVPSA